MIGRTVGRYHIIAKLGEGGMGTVWKARDALLGRTVAIKFLPESLASSAVARRRFLRGARAVAELDHPGIAAIFDAGEAEGLPYVAGALIDGETVGRLAARGPLPIPEVVRIARDAAEALQHAHARGVIHRDVSTGNIMVGRDGRIALLDFGLARIASDRTSRITRSGTAIGTLAYMAPEVAIGRPADARADVYGLGAVAYELVTGSPPFAAERPEALLYKAVNEPLDPPRRRRQGVPVALERILLKALAKDPERRYSNAGAMFADLCALRVGGRRRESARGVTIRPHLSPRGRRTGAAPGARAPGRAKRRGALPETKILLIVPFHDRPVTAARDRDASGLAGGLAEVISARLSGIQGMEIVPPAAVPASSVADSDPRTAARSVGASLVLNGAVQHSGRRLRATWSLMSAQDGLQIAGDVVDGTDRALLLLEDRLVRSVARALRVEAVTSRAGGGVRPVDPAAREHYLQALGLLQRHGDEVAIDGAIRLLEWVLEADHDKPQVRVALGRAYLAKFQLTYDTVWQERARRTCARALQHSPGSPEALVTLGHLHNSVGRYPQAARALRRALATRPGDVDALFALVTACEGTNRIDEAERACHEIIALRPSYWLGYNRLGTLYFKLGRYEEAAQLFRRVIELDPVGSRGHGNLGSAYYHMGRWADAIAAYGRSLEIHPNATAYTSLGTVYFFLGRYDEAAAEFERAAALRPFDPKLWGNLADAYWWMPGRKEKAVTAYEQATRLTSDQLEINPHVGKRWVEQGIWLSKLGRSREALRAIGRGLRLAPHDLNAMALAVTGYELCGRRERAFEWLSRVVAHGYDRTELERDPELVALRQDPRYRRITTETRAV